MYINDEIRQNAKDKMVAFFGKDILRDL